MEESRTLLVERINEGCKNPLENLSYNIISNRLVAMGGYETYQINAEIVNNHYLISSHNVVRSFEKKALAIVDIDKPEEAVNRMYQEAKRIAREEAKHSHNKLLDFTSRAKRIPSDAQYYSLDDYLDLSHREK